MFGDDSKLRLRRQSNTEALGSGYYDGPILPTYSNQSHPGGTGGDGSKSVNRRRKRIRRRQIFKRWAKTCLSGIAATFFSASLSLLLLPFSWTQVDYHHQVQRAASHLWQRVEQNRRNESTAIRGSQPIHYTQVKCSDGTIGFLNDDYCDCWEDGSDEPLTSACSNVHVQKAMFACKSEPSKKLFASRVHDGVKDCPDGSDEA